MTRKKVKLAFITNDSARKATFKKRKKGLMKKVHELSTLCGIDACAIIYSPYDAQPEVWPNNLGVQHILAQFRKISEMDRSKNMLNQESFIRKQIGKANEQLKKQMKENREKEMTEVMYQCLTGKGSIENLSLADLKDLGGLVDQTLADISKRIESLKIGGNSSNTTDDKKKKGVAMNPPEKQNMVEDNATVDVMQRTPWFTEWMHNPAENNLGIGPYAMAQYAENPNRLWPHPFFPEG